MKPRIVTFGELLLRLSPPGYARFVQADGFRADYGGAEANVAISLANFGMDAAFVTKLPAHEIGQAAVNTLRRFGVDTSGILRGGGRIGLYYLEKGASQRASQVIYDRAGSALATADPDEFDWDKIFDGADWFHLSGITPALGDSCVRLCRAACLAAREKGIRISMDVNFRRNLWSAKQAGPILSELLGYVNMAVLSQEEATELLGATLRPSNDEDRAGRIAAIRETLQELTERFGWDMAASTLRESLSADINRLSALLLTKEGDYVSPVHTLHIVDRVGGGDSFTAGLIYSVLSGCSPQETVDFAVAASALKHSIEGDFNLVSVAEAHAVMSAGGSVRVRR